MASFMTGYRDVDEASNWRGSTRRSVTYSVRSPSIYEPAPPLVSEPTTGFTRREILILVACSCSSMFMHMGISTIPLVLPIEIQNKGVPYEYCGAIFSVFAVSIVILEPFQAKILPRVGTRNGFCFSALLGGICYISFAMIHFSTTVAGFVAPAMIIRFVEGFYYAVLITASNVIVCLTFPDRASFAFGVLEGFVGAGFTLGPLVGGALFKFVGFPAPFLLIGVCLLSTAVLGYFSLEQITGLDLAPRKKEKNRLLRDTAFLGCAVLTMAAGVVWGIFETALEPYLSTYDKGPFVEGIVFAIAYLAYGAMAPLWGYLFRKVHMDYRWILLGPIIVGVIWMILGPIPALSFIGKYFDRRLNSNTVSDVFDFASLLFRIGNQRSFALWPGKELWLDTICLFLLNSTIAYIFVFSFDTMLKRAILCGMEGDVATYALVVAAFFTTIYIGEAVGPIIGGYLIAHTSFQDVAAVATIIQFVAAGVAAIIMLIAWNKIVKRIRRRLNRRFPTWFSAPEELGAPGETSSILSSSDDADEDLNIFQPPTASRKTGAIRYDRPKSYGSIY